MRAGESAAASRLPYRSAEREFNEAQSEFLKPNLFWKCYDDK
jgi:hypothetical protein